MNFNVTKVTLQTDFYHIKLYVTKVTLLKIKGDIFTTLNYNK